MPKVWERAIACTHTIDCTQCGQTHYINLADWQ